jgi:hypothetical protein
VSKAPTQLKLSIMCTIAPFLLIQLFTRFRSARPDVKLELIQLVEEQLVTSNAEVAVYCRCDRAPDPRLNYITAVLRADDDCAPGRTPPRFARNHRDRISPASAMCSGATASSTTWRMPYSMPAASIAKLSSAAIVMIGCWPWSRAVSAFSQIFDLEPGRHCEAAGQSGILA